MTFLTDVLDDSLLRRLSSFARRFVSDAHDADDVAQEALLRAARSDTSPRHPERTEAWLFRICRHAAIDHVRSRRVRRAVWMELPGDAPEPASGARGVLDARGARDAHDDGSDRLGGGQDAASDWRPLSGELARLPAHQRLLMVLHYERTLPQAALCRMTGLSPSALRVRLYRARLALGIEPG
ncbi:MAG: sigma-70 family RNA polymerase sigma factor [Planctomycetes bacterium]|nr:sigma-70 family RNA polymerase sigma factor [Planctomycetota bacterium]